jgi:hypothetical protein
MSLALLALSAAGAWAGRRAYRFGFWYDPQPKGRFDGATKRDDFGF